MKTAPSIAILVCVHNALDDVKLCLAAINQADYEGRLSIVIVDDGSNAATAQYLEFFAEGAPEVELIRRDAAKGYTNSANTALKATDADFLILLNSDTIPSRQSFRKIVEVFQTSSDVGIVGPLSNAASWQSVPDLSAPGGGWSENPLPDGVSADDVDRMLDSADIELPKTVRTPLVNGFCFAIRRLVIDEIGYLDEDSFPFGYGEEDDFCLRAADAGFGIAIAIRAFVYHAKSKSFGHEKRSKLNAQGQVALKKKHGETRLQRAVEALRLNPYLGAVRDAIRTSLTTTHKPRIRENEDRVPHH
ncbi:MAG: glycosyltransferase family 2 protein [Pseudomonadota bacterium]